MTGKEFFIRAVRKSSSILTRALRKGANVTNRVENKTNRILMGTDPSIKLNKAVPFQKIYYEGLSLVTPLNPAMPAIGSKPSVTLLIPSLDNSSFFGGAATALIVAAKFALKMGRQLRIVQTVKTGDSVDLEAHFHSEGINIKNDQIKVISVAERKFDILAYIPMHKEDLFIVSAWWDAYLVNKLPVDKFVYLVQDFEPAFYNNSDQYVLAEGTYQSSKIIPLCNTKLMYDFMLERQYPEIVKDNAYFFEPAVSRLASGKLIHKEHGVKQRIFLYGRQNVSRNLFFTAIEALNIALNKGYITGENFEFYMAGQEGLPDIILESGVRIQNVGKMSMGDYIQFSKTIDIAISPMMAPHPNYPTLEFASIGSAVVTTKYSNKQSLGTYSKNIFMSDTDAESMAEMIKLAAEKKYDEKLRDLEDNVILSDWDDSLATPIIEIVRKFNFVIE
ncbi:hypothetical protein [Lactovum miscens]|uniref:Glycosyltransferase n=1 Tax=Lactovum miscens TaxID=190387 RepID=A0A841C5F9_9LACT|nr:hypothetical protein [Lactovum miscens]MBB5887675.1 hypothetical protein [Lactovum miscens]